MHTSFSLEYVLTTDLVFPVISVLFDCASILSASLMKGIMGLYLSSLLLRLSRLPHQRGEFKNAAVSVNAAEASVITHLMVSYMVFIFASSSFYAAKGLELLFLVASTGIARNSCVCMQITNLLFHSRNKNDNNLQFC